MSELLLATAYAMGCLLLWKQRSLFSPLGVMLIAYTLVFFVAGLRLIEMPGVGLKVTCYYLLALCIAVAAHLVFGPRRSVQSQHPSAAVPVSGKVVGIAAALLLLLSVIGTWAYLGRLSAIWGTSGLTEFTAYQRRAGGRMIEGGGVVLLSAALPALAAVSVYGTRYLSRWYLALLPTAVMLAGQNSNRTWVGVTAATGVFALLMAFPSLRRAKVLGVGVAALAIAWFVYFNWVGEALFKNDAEQYVVYRHIPASLVTLVTYIASGPAAFSEAVVTGYDPYLSGHGRSIYVVLRALSSLGLVDAPPELQMGYVDFPFLFNMYTGWGDIFLDAGLLGLVVASCFAGLVSGLVLRLVARPNPEALLIFAYTCAIYLQHVFSNSFGLLITWATAVLGLACFGVARIVTGRGRTGQGVRRPVAARKAPPDSGGARVREFPDATQLDPD